MRHYPARSHKAPLDNAYLPIGVVDIVFATMHSEQMSDDDRAELMRLRESIRDHWAMLSGRGKNPLDGVTWSPDADRFDTLLLSLATGAGLDVPVLPWTNPQRLEVDELCRSAGVLDGLPLLAA